MLKKIEYAVKGFFDKMLSKDSNPVLINKTEAIFRLTDRSRLLLLRHDRIGDVIVTTPFLTILRKAFPIIEIDMLMSPNNISAQRAVDSYINNIYVYDKKLVNIIKLFRKLKNRKYDIIIDLFDNPSTTSSYIIKFVKPKYSLGFDKSNSAVYTHIVPLPNKNEVHIVERIANLLMPFGIEPAQSAGELSFHLNPEERKKANELIKRNGKKVLGINLSGSSRAKYWGTDNFTEFINEFAIKFTDYKVVIFSMPDYETELNQIISSTLAEKAPKADSFVEYASYLSVCDLLLTPDTAAVHLAAAFKVPCISLHLWTGSSDTGMPWHPYNSPYKMLKTDTGNLADISVESVLNAAAEIIEGKN